MRIRINGFSFPVPLSERLVRLVLKDRGVDRVLAGEMISALKHYRREYGRFCLVEVDTHDGMHVEITV